MTYREAFNTMQEPYRSQALKNTIPSELDVEARKILRDTVYHAGRSNWPGMHNQVTDILGEFEAFDKYQECERVSEIFINHNFPNFN